MELSDQQEARRQRLALLKRKRESSKPQIKSRNFNFESKQPVSSFDIIQQQQQKQQQQEQQDNNENKEGETYSIKDGLISYINNNDDLETKSKNVSLNLITKFDEKAKILSSKSFREDKKSAKLILDNELNELEKDDETILEYDEELKDELDILKQETELQLSRMIKSRLKSLVRSQNKD